MKMRFSFFIAAVLLSTAISALAVQRLVLHEHFTNASCPPCAAANPAHRAMMAALGHDTVAGIAYHVWWPGVDPMYNLNTSEVQTRTQYYNITGVPHVKIDGTWGTTPSSTNTATVRNQIRNRYFNSPSPCAIELNAYVSGETSIAFDVTVTAESDITANTRLFVVLITDTIQYTSPPGSNGETLFEDVFRDGWPNMTGQAFSLTAGQQAEFSGSLNRQAGWLASDLRVIAFVTNYTSKEVHQAAYSFVNQFYGARMESTGPHQIMAAANGGDQEFYMDIQSLGLNEDTYTVELSGDLPTGWTRTIEADGVTPDADAIDVTVEGLGAATLTLKLNPNGHPGSANVGVRVTSANMETLELVDDFSVVSDVELLIVDDDEGEEYESYYTAGLAAAFASRGESMLVGRWDMSRDPLDADISSADLVIWYTGRGFQQETTLTEADQLLLIDYLNSGGNLFVCGEGIGFDLIHDEDFLAGMLHIDFGGPRATLDEVSGISGDVIGDNLNFRVDDDNGDGIDQQRQHSLNLLDEVAQPIFIYNGSILTSGVRVATETYKAVYLGFGYEGINNADDRNLLMTRILDWMFPLSAADPREGVLPTVYSLEQNFPNPFNPETTIPYMLPERAHVQLSVYDLLGREVATLVNGVMEAGVHSASFNGAQLSSGVYFYRMEAGDYKQTRKLMLMK